MRITSRGQVTIPAEIREKAGLETDGETVQIVRAAAHRNETRGQRAVRLLCGSATVKMPTDEIMALTRGED